MTDNLSDVAELFSGSGEPLSGFEGDADEAEAEAILRHSWKPYCIVKGWMLIEIEVADEYRESLARDGLQPYVLYASNVLRHGANKRQIGDWVRSTYQQSFSDGYVFETCNTTYFLLGKGLRKKACIQTLTALVGLY